GEAERGATVLHRRRVRGLRDRHAARCSVAVAARDTDVPAVRGGSLLRPLRQEARRGRVGLQAAERNRDGARARSLTEYQCSAPPIWKTMVRELPGSYARA